MTNSSARRQGREFALKIIYSLFDHDSISIEQAFGDFWKQFRFHDGPLGDPLDSTDQPIPFEARRFAELLVTGVNEHLEEIDETLRGCSTNWSLERMARVDLALLRLGVFELVYCPDIPINVTINEAIEVGKRYGTKETPSFVNGILDRISRNVRKDEEPSREGRTR